jgi:hypothetical protein
MTSTVVATSPILRPTRSMMRPKPGFIYIHIQH